MPANLDPASPVPLYHQLAELLRYRIATGALKPGTVLPSLRDAARQWRVNLHTARHAYAALAELGLVRTEAPRGTVVLGGSRRTPGDPTERFLARMLHEARERFGLSPDDVRHRLDLLEQPPGGAGKTVHVIECSESQAADLASQVGARWNVPARGWSLERPGAPPAGPLVATYFHYNDIRTRWPERFGSVRFVAIRPDPALTARLASFRRGRGRTPVLVCEREAAMAASIAADVKAVLPADRFEVTPRVESSPGAALAAAPKGTPVLFAPRVWAALTPAQHADPRAVEIRYLIEPKDLAELAELGERLGLAPASPRRPRTRATIVALMVVVAAASQGCAGGPQAAPFDRAQSAFMSHDFPAAESAYRQVLADDTVEAHKSEAAVTLAAIAWRVRQDTIAAARVLAEAARTSWGRYPARLERSRMLRAVGDYAGARAAAADAASTAGTPIERDEATVAWAQAVIMPALAERLRAGTPAGAAATSGTHLANPADPTDATDPALLREALARLDSLVRRAPGRLDPARLLVLGGALAGDRGAIADGWRSYYLVGTGDTSRGPLAAPRRTIRTGDGSLVRALAESRFFDAAAAMALEPGPGGATLAVRDAEAREMVAYAAFLDAVTRLTDEYYRKTALGQGHTSVWNAGLDSAGRALWPVLRWSGSVPPFSRKQLGQELDRRFGAVVNLGETAGYQDLHLGHRVVDEQRTVRQYGRAATVRFVALDGIVSNGFQSWAWDGRAEHGGWGSKAMIVQIRPRYAESPLHAWRDITDTARVRRAAEQIAEDSAADLVVAGRKPVAYFPSVAERLERDGRRELLDSLRRSGLAGLELEAAFERTIGDALVESSIFAHEGRHAIDDALGEKLSPAELEYRAKLSEVAFAPHARLAFGGIMSPNMGDDTPHGIANRRMLEGIERWMRQHAAELPVDPSLPLLPQLPRLDDASLRAAAAALDPLAPGGGSRKPPPS